MKKFFNIIILFLATAVFLLLLVFITAKLLPESQIINLPWYITRATALTAFGFMFLIVVWGTSMTTGFVYDYINPTRAWLIHKYLSLAMTALIFVHAGSLLFDKFLKFNLVEILIPFVSNFKTWFLSLGIIGFYVLLLIIIMSTLFRLRAPKLWRSTHYCVYFLFALVLIHGFFIGTDSSSPVMRFVYPITGIIFIALLIYRFIIYRFKTKLN